jgi:xylulokinase
MFLGIDCGTQGTKALLLDEQGEVLGRGYAPHALIEKPSGAREQDPAWWVEALRLSVAQALVGSSTAQRRDAGRVQVQGIGVSGQQHGLVVLDETLAVIRPAKLWNDTETAPQNEEIMQRLGGREAFLERFGIVPLTGYTVSKLLWLKQQEPENFARIRHILLPHEYLNFWLTGQMRAEYGDASGTAYFDVRTRQWAREVLDAIDGGTGQLFAALPPLMAADQQVGIVRPEVAREFGFGSQCIVSAGGGDNMMGAIGTANVREGVVTLSLGTSSTVYTYQPAPSVDATGQVAPFCSSSNGWLPLVCTMNATNVVTGTVQLLGRTVADIEAALAHTPPGADGLVFLPFLNGERTPDLPTARGSLHGIAPGNFTPDHLIRAAVEGVTFGILSGLDRMLHGKPARVVQLIGGGARSAAWRQLIADATGAEIHVPAEEESGCLGAVIQAMVAVSAQTAAPRTFEQVAAQMVKVKPEETAHPDAALAAAYTQAREAYHRQLASSYPKASNHLQPELKMKPQPEMRV